MPRFWSLCAWPVMAAAAALAACASPEAPTAASAAQPAATTEPSARTGRRCFRANEVNGWRAGDNNTVYVRTGVRRIFRMELMGPCPDINWNQRIGIEARGSGWICSGLDATIVSPSTIGPRHCPVRRITELSQQEADALPSRFRP